MVDKLKLLSYELGYWIIALKHIAEEKNQRVVRRTFEVPEGKFEILFERNDF